ARIGPRNVRAPPPSRDGDGRAAQQSARRYTHHHQQHTRHDADHVSTVTVGCDSYADAGSNAGMSWLPRKDATALRMGPRRSRAYFRTASLKALTRSPDTVSPANASTVRFVAGSPFTRSDTRAVATSRRPAASSAFA